MSNEASLLIQQGYEARRANLPAEARQLFSEAVELTRNADDQEQLALALKGLGQIERDLGKRQASLHCYEESSAILRQLDEPLALAHTVRHVADISRLLGKTEQAACCYREALTVYRAHPEAPPLDLANAMAGFARLLGDGLDPAQAQIYWLEAKQIYLSCGVADGVSESDRHLAKLTRPALKTTD